MGSKPRIWEPEFFGVKPGPDPNEKKSGFNSGQGERKWHPGLKPGRLNPDPDPDPDFAIPNLNCRSYKTKISTSTIDLTKIKCQPQP